MLWGAISCEGIVGEYNVQVNREWFSWLFPDVDTLVVFRDDSTWPLDLEQSQEEKSNNVKVSKKIKLFLKGGEQPEAKPKLRKSSGCANNQSSTTSGEEVTMKATSSTHRKLGQTVSDTQATQKIPVITSQQRTVFHTDLNPSSDYTHHPESIEK